MAREAYIYRLILTWLERNPGLHTTREICEGTSVPYSSVARVVKTLAREKRVRKRLGSGSGFLYEFTTFEVQDKNKKNFARVPVLSQPPLKPSDIINITTSWIKSGWKPAALPAARTLVETMSKLYKFYWLELERNITVDQTDLDFIKSQLIEARDKAVRFAEFFDRLINTDQLWDAKASLTYVLGDLPDDTDPIAFCTQARTVEDCIQL